MSPPYFFAPASNAQSYLQLFMFPKPLNPALKCHLRNLKIKKTDQATSQTSYKRNTGWQQTHAKCRYTRNCQCKKKIDRKGRDFRSSLGFQLSARFSFCQQSKVQKVKTGNRESKGTMYSVENQVEKRVKDAAWSNIQKCSCRCNRSKWLPTPAVALCAFEGNKKAAAMNPHI